MNNNENGKRLENAFRQLGASVTFVGQSVSSQLVTYYFDYDNIAQYSKNKLQGVVDKMCLYYHIKFSIVHSDTAHFGITMPNREFATLWLTSLKQPCDKHSINIGKDLMNKDIILDFDRISHLLIAGTTGSGKSILLKSLMYSLFSSIGCDNFDLIILDPKRTEFQIFKERNNVRYVDETLEGIEIINGLVNEMEYRYSEMAKGNNNFRHIFVVVDELADLMLTSHYDIESSIVRLAQKARAAKIHLILATQRPTVNIVTGLIKANMPNRICLKMPAGVDSRVVLDHKGAEELLGRGDALIRLDGSCNETRFQCAMISDSNIKQSLYGG